MSERAKKALSSDSLGELGGTRGELKPQSRFRAGLGAGQRRWLGLILWGYLVVTLAYGVVNPLFEAPDEHWHYFTAQYVADRGKLPVVLEEYDEWLSQEAAQPPLYYWLASGLIRLVGVVDGRGEVWLNPHFATAVGDASAVANKNLVVHREAWPWQGVVLAVHGLRIVSALLGVGTLLCVYGSGRLLWPDAPQRALLAMGLVAFLPQFNFVHASVTNDVLITLLASLAVWQVVRIWRRGELGGTGGSWGELLGLGVTVGLAALTKTAGVLLGVYVVGVLVVAGGKGLGARGRWHYFLRVFLFVIGPVLLLAGWLWWRNWVLYGDVTAANQFVRIAGGDRGYSLGQVLAEMPGLWRSLFGIFGWFNVLPPGWVFWLWQGIVVLGVVGGVWQVAGGRWQGSGLSPLTFRLSPFVLLGGWVLLVYGGLVAFMLRTPAAQGRLLFPAIVPLALGLAYGLSRFRWGVWLWPVLGLVTAVGGLVVIGGAYERPSTITTLPDDVPLLNVDMGQGVTLLGARVETDTAVVPGDVVWLTLYWRADGGLSDAPEMVLDLFGRDLERPLGKVQSYHGRGLYPANLWPVGEIVVDRVGVRVAGGMGQGADLPVLAQGFVQLVGDDVGEREAVLVGEVKVVPLIWPEPGGEVLAMVGEGVGVTAVAMMPTMVKAGDVVTVHVEWQVLAALGGDFTTFVHLAEAGQPPLATGDGVPGNGRYPTRVWAAGEVVEDVYSFVVPGGVDGRYPVWLGMYDPVSGGRLPLTVNGERQPNEAYLVGWVMIE
ncbi:MAG: DUF2142 domain-containing protein [Ardenticatenaceae bacterium]|nr:DUF2142 domain-containing protein [Ardenticatenaceae bacterium]